MRLEEIPVTAQTYALSLATAMRMPVGADIPAADPAMIRTRDMRAEMAGGVDLAATTTGHEHQGWRCPGSLRVQPALPHTQCAIGLASETGRDRLLNGTPRRW